MTPTCNCGRPVKDNARLCSDCTDRLARDLGDLGALDAELQTTRLRQSRTGGAATGVLSRSQDKPLPWDEDAAEAAYVLRSTVVGWVRVVLDERGGRCPADTMQSMGTMLLGSLEWLRHHPAADECADEIGSAVRLAWRTVDRRDERSYAGPCREVIDADGDDGDACCLAELHVKTGAATVVCPECRARHDVTERRAWLLAVAEEQLVTRNELCRLLTSNGYPLPTGTLDSWVAKRRILGHGTEPARYRVGDALKLLTDRQAQRYSA